MIRSIFLILLLTLPSCTVLRRASYALPYPIPEEWNVYTALTFRYENDEAFSGLYEMMYKYYPGGGRDKGLRQLAAFRADLDELHLLAHAAWNEAVSGEGSLSGLESLFRRYQGKMGLFEQEARKILAGKDISPELRTALGGVAAIVSMALPRLSLDGKELGLLPEHRFEDRGKWAEGVINEHRKKDLARQAAEAEAMFLMQQDLTVPDLPNPASKRPIIRRAPPRSLEPIPFSSPASPQVIDGVTQ